MENIVKKLPVVIDPCPIEEAIFEIRYSSKIPNEARFWNALWSNWWFF